jgi:hypothetical protein
MMRLVPRETYQAMFRAYLAKQGPNLGSGFNGMSAWHSMKENEFREIYKVLPIEPKSTARPGSFSQFVRESDS